MRIELNYEEIIIDNSRKVHIYFSYFSENKCLYFINAHYFLDHKRSDGDSIGGDGPTKHFVFIEVKEEIEIDGDFILGTFYDCNAALSDLMNEEIISKKIKEGAGIILFDSHRVNPFKMSFIPDIHLEYKDCNAYFNIAFERLLVFKKHDLYTVDYFCKGKKNAGFLSIVEKSSEKKRKNKKGKWCVWIGDSINYFSNYKKFKKTIENLNI